MNSKQFVKKRNEALFSLDRNKILKFYRKIYGKQKAKEFADADETVFWASVYKSIYHITSSPAVLKRYAETWLTIHGFSTEV